MTGPLVSIVTPTLNQGRFIEATLRSVMAQTYQNIEHIVVDAGSTDATKEILARYEGRYPLRWTSEPDAGMYDGINKGFREARGEVLAYLNSDDVYTPWAIEAVVEQMTTGGSDVVFGDAILIFDTDPRPRMAFQPPFGPKALHRTGTLVQPAVFWKRRVRDAVGGFDLSVQLVADLDYWLRVRRQFAFTRIDEVLAVERHHATAKTTVGAAAVRVESQLVRGSRTPGTLIRAFLDRAAAWAWRRGTWVTFTRQAACEHPEHWHELFVHAPPRLSWTRVAALQLPILGRRLGGGAVSWPEGWLDRLTGPSELSGPAEQ